MKKIIIIISVFIFAGAGWYLGSPLFLSNEINEAFPELDTLPTEEEIMKMMEGMSEKELDNFEKELMEKAASLPGTEMKESAPFDETMPVEGDEPPQFPFVLAEGEFRDADNFHKGSGIVTAYELETGKRFLRFEDFSVTNGPDLRVFLTSHADPKSESDVKSGAYIEIAKLKGNKGNQNYELPPNIDIDDYNAVLIYCKPFHVVFSTASLN